jgi:SAM-dependent methyltransferase
MSFELRKRLRAAVAHRGLRDYQIAYEPELVPPRPLMATEGIDVLEEWFRWGEEWSMLLRVHGRLRRDSAVLEVGCGLGRTAFPLRYILSSTGTYDGFDVDEGKIAFLNETFNAAHPNFRFRRANVHNTYYNPTGTVPGAAYTFPYPDDNFDVVYGASVITHMLPEGMQRYLVESRRVLRDDGRCLFSVFLLDNYRQGQERPLGFAHRRFDFDHEFGDYADRFAISNPHNPEEMTAYRLDLFKAFAHEARLQLVNEALPGAWSGSFDRWIGAQDLLAGRLAATPLSSLRNRHWEGRVIWTPHSTSSSSVAVATSGFRSGLRWPIVA